MQNSFKQINEIIDNLLVICNEECQLPKIEKDILLEKLRKLYLQSQMIEELEIPAKLDEEQPEYEVHKGMEDDVDLFFDTDHESYGAPAKVQEAEPVEESVIPAEPVKKPEPALELKLEVEPDPKPEPAPEPVKTPVAEPKAPTVQPSQVTPKPDKIIEPEPIVENDEDDLLQFIPQKSAPKVEPTPKTEPAPKVEKPIVEQHVKPEPAAPRSLNDLFNKQQEDRSLGSQFQHAKVVDLTKAISINDKFTFIKELFNNKGEEFSAAIQQLNQCANMDQAFDCLETLKKKYFWDSTATAYLSLCDLLRRKFI